VTWEGIPKKYRPLADRRNCVLSREGTNESLGLPSEVTVCSSIQAALEEFKEAEAIWFLGGAQVYYQAIEYATLVHMTLIPDETNLGNLVYYPEKCRKLSSHDGWQLRKMPHPHNEALVINEYFRKTPQKKRP
jgi:dihydrofolate reductase